MWNDRRQQCAFLHFDRIVTKYTQDTTELPSVSMSYDNKAYNHQINFGFYKRLQHYQLMDIGSYHIDT